MSEEKSVLIISLCYSIAAAPYKRPKEAVHRYSNNGCNHFCSAMLTGYTVAHDGKCKHNQSPKPTEDSTKVLNLCFFKK